MTPDWLYKHSTITKPFAVHPKYLEISSGTRDERVIQTELIAPNVLTATDSVAVTLTIVMDAAFADNSDQDFIFGISDGTSFVGFVVVDKSNYAAEPPCFAYEGINTNGFLTSKKVDYSGRRVKSRLYSSEITLKFKTNDQWGSCHTEHDEGIVEIRNYYYKLDLTKGLYLEMYQEWRGEKHRIEYIEANIHLV